MEDEAFAQDADVGCMKTRLKNSQSTSMRDVAKVQLDVCRSHTGCSPVCKFNIP